MAWHSRKGHCLHLRKCTSHRPNSLLEKSSAHWGPYSRKWNPTHSKRTESSSNLIGYRLVKILQQVYRRHNR